MGLCFSIQASVALLVVVAMSTLPAHEKLVTYTRLVEAAVPFLAAVMGAYAFAPDNEPVIELLLVYPRPLWQTVLERFIYMAGMMATSSVASSLLFLTLNNQLNLNNLAQLAMTLGPPGLFVGALGLATTMYMARGTAGLLTTLIVCLMMAALPDELLAAFPLLKWVYIFPFSRYGPSWAGWLTNRLILIVLGILMSIVALYFTRDSERLLRI